MFLCVFSIFIENENRKQVNQTQPNILIKQDYEIYTKVVSGGRACPARPERSPSHKMKKETV